MYLFRNCISVLPLLCAFCISDAQQLGEFDVRRGINPFFLGSIRTNKDSSIQLADAGKFEHKGITEYTYFYPAVTKHPYLLGGVDFKNIILTYVSDTLVKVMLTSIYTPTLYKDYDKRANQEFHRLVKFLKEQWKSAGRKRTFLQSPDKQIITEGLQWDMENATMKVSLYEDKNKANRMYDISITWELHGYN
jgi:hypothetical protein